MSVLQSIQNIIFDELTSISLLGHISIYPTSFGTSPTKKKGLSAIEISLPFPVSSVKNAANVIFDEVLIEIKITSPKNTARESESIMDICESVCKTLHNKRLKTHRQSWKILIGEQKPFAYNSEANTNSITIKFFIQSVKL